MSQPNYPGPTPLSSSAPLPPAGGFSVSYPAPHILLVTLERERAMNSIPFALHWHLHALFVWFDREPELRVAIITGKGKKAFCAGQDLIELGKRQGSKGGEGGKVSSGGDGDQGVLDLVKASMGHPPSGFAGISRRVGKKPIVAAVNGFALGGGFEIVLNCDLIVASPTATFGLPEALRGIYAGAGGLPRILNNTSLPIAMEIALTGRTLSAQEALQYLLINKVSASQDSLIDEAVALAQKVANISPDAIIVSRAAIRQGWESASVERGYQLADERWREGLFKSENVGEGLSAFAQKRKPKWVGSKL